MATILDLIQTAAEEGVSSVTSDGQSVTARPIADLIAADRYLKSQAALVGVNRYGGPKSGWGCLRTAIAIPQGGLPGRVVGGA